MLFRSHPGGCFLLNDCPEFLRVDQGTLLDGINLFTVSPWLVPSVSFG
jgi:hypothetical protein